MVDFVNVIYLRNLSLRAEMDLIKMTVVNNNKVESVCLFTSSMESLSVLSRFVSNDP